MTDHQEPLRIGILLDSWQIAAWQKRTLEHIASSAYGRIVLVVLNAEIPRRPGLLLRLWQAAPRILYALYQRVDRLLFGLYENRLHGDALKEVDISGLLSAVALKKVVPERKGKVCRLPESFLAELRSERIDVLLRFGFGILKGEVLKIPRYGVWSYHHGDNELYRGSPPLFWEIQERNPICGAVVQRLTEDLDGGEVLYRGFFPTYPLSLYRNQNRIFQRSAAFMERCLRNLVELGPQRFFSQYPGVSCDRPLYRIPGNFAMLIYLWRLGCHLLRYLPERLLYREKWFVAYRSSKSTALTAGKNGSGGWKIAKAPRGHFYADPFVVNWQGQQAVFFEDYDFSREKGAIACFQIGTDGKASAARQVLDLQEHLSYPYLFSWEGGLYMLPETSAAAKLSLWRCVDFPGKWEQAGVLLDGVRCVDASLVFWQEKYWLFACMPEDPADSSRELSIFYAQNPLGPWTAHPLNPVKSDIRSARPAGHPFVHEGKLYRPAQDCSKRYGGGIVLCRVEELSTQTFAECVVSRLEFEFPLNNLGSHTYNFNEEFEVTDGRVRVLRWLV